MDDEETLYKIVSTLSIITVYLPVFASSIKLYIYRERDGLESLISLMLFTSNFDNSVIYNKYITIMLQS